MSGFAALVNLGVPTAIPRATARMAQWLQRRGRDGLTEWAEGGVGLVHAALHTSPLETTGTQPAVSPCGRFHLTSYARIDNGLELRAELGSAELPALVSDPELILAAYARWGADCVRHLVGDFAFALWDGPAKTLFCARDPLGVRALHYSADRGRIVVASEVGAVLAGVEPQPAYHRAFLEDVLANQWTRYLHETAYSGVYRLPPAHRMWFSADGVRLDRYWTPEVRLARADPRELLEEFRSRLTVAVSRRLQAPGPVGIAVSGGMDSSSLACVSERLVTTEARNPVRLYSTVYRDTAGADEREYFDAVAAHCRHLQSRALPSDDCWTMREFGRDGGFPLDEPEVGMNRMLPLRLARAAAEDGCRVLLSGFGGDQVLCGEPYFLPHLLRDVPLRDVPRELRYFRRFSRRSAGWILATAYGLPLLPAAWQTALVRRLRRAETAGLGLPLRQPSTAPLTMPNPLRAPELPSRAAAEIFRQVSSGLFHAELSDLITAGLESGVEWRFPFLDQQLVELMLSMPAALLFGNGVAKRPVREGLADLLPERIRTRAGFAHFSELVQRGLRDREQARRRDLLTQPLLAREGLVDPARLQAAWEQWENEPERYCSRALFVSLPVEVWLRSKEEEGAVDLANCPAD